MAAASATGAVFFLGTRAHYQVLQQPTQCDIDNGNATDTYRCHDDNDDEDKLDMGTGVKRRSRRASEVALCERDGMNPALLNTRDEDTPKKPRRRGAVLAYLQSFGRRKQDTDRMLHSYDGALFNCTYRESCRCLECQSSYFDCDESDNYYSSEESECDYNLEYNYDYPPRYVSQELPVEEDEVFVTAAPGDNTSNDLLIDGQTQGLPPPPETKMSTSSDEVDNDELQLEVAAGTPVVLNYLLTHPITCSIQ